MIVPELHEACFFRLPYMCSIKLWILSVWSMLARELPRSHSMHVQQTTSLWYNFYNKFHSDDNIVIVFVFRPFSLLTSSDYIFDDDTSECEKAEKGEYDHSTYNYSKLTTRPADLEITNPFFQPDLALEEKILTPNAVPD
ncbi:unnamed protein product [Dicrocoelium dendriticum]|nr:unnamed protein product [Dicrocoelium dendriticum]